MLVRIVPEALVSLSSRYDVRTARLHINTREDTRPCTCLPPKEHLAPFALHVADRLTQHAKTAFYLGVAAITKAVVSGQ
jgi:TorA maturation chaperone TorD